MGLYEMFCDCWDLLEAAGFCDTAGGSEWRRVIKEYVIFLVSFERKLTRGELVNFIKDRAKVTSAEGSARRPYPTREAGRKKKRKG